MGDIGRILIADDEETFLYSTADLLRREGYECDCALDAANAFNMLRNDKYDLLISDIKMPGNAQLEFIKELPNIAEGMPVILVTGYPSLNSAVQSIQLPVMAYMPKPLDFDELLLHVKNSINHSRIYRAIYYLRKRLQECHEGITSIGNVYNSVSGRTSSIPVDAFLELTFHNIIGAMSDLMHLTESFAKQEASQEANQEVCHLLNCPKLIELTSAIEDTINVLEKTKNSFKSKELGELRQRLERIVKNKSDTNKKLLDQKVLT